LTAAPTPHQNNTASSLTREEGSLRGLGGVDVPITIERLGTGRPIVFLHGLVGLNEHWDDVVELVQHRLACVMLQVPLLALRGSDCSIDGVMVLTIQFLERHFNEPVVLVGNSFGGHVALRVAIERPDLVSGLVLTGSSGMIEESIVSNVQIRPSREWLRRKIAELFYDPDKYMSESDLDRAHKELSERPGARAMVRLSRSARRNHLGDRTRNLAVPTQLIWGKDDIVTPPQAAEMFMRAIPDSRIEWFEACGHVPMIEKPQAFARVLLQFAAELDAKACEPSKTG
jgi:2-hydroxy-6-oxonona-2,4-dienedioate hydrolase